jgi:SAM-dependent methyltransferase
MKLLTSFRFLGYQLALSKIDTNIKTTSMPKNLFSGDIKLNFGPGPHWNKPDGSWHSVDVDPALGDIVVNFQDFDSLPINDTSVSCVYGSHVFEHISIFKSQAVFNEIYRVLKHNGIFRLVLPDVEKSINEYVNRNNNYKLFARRTERARSQYGVEYTLFQCLREDFLSPTGQTHLLGERSLAHQNAWDYESIVQDLQTAGFHASKIKKMDFQKSQCDSFSFEGTFPSEANEDYRSLYVEALK